MKQINENSSFNQAYSKETFRCLVSGEMVSNDTRKTNLSNHDLIIGPSGSGKTGSYVVPNLLSTEESIVVMDTKGNLYRNYAKLLRKKGFNVYSVDFCNPEISSSYNPLRYVHYKFKNGKRVYSDLDITSVANIICPNENLKDPFWDKSAQNVIACLISYVLEELDECDRNMCSVLELSKELTPDSSGEIRFLNEHMIKHPNTLCARKYPGIRSIIPADRTWACILGMVNTALSCLDSDELQEMFSKNPDFRFEDLGRRKTALILHTSDNDHSLDKLSTLFFTQALQTLCKEADAQPDSRLAVPVRIIMDDFASSISIPEFDKIISILRSREVSVSCVIQSLSQLESCYSAAQAKTILNNCDHIMYLGGSDRESVNYVADRSRVVADEVMCMPLTKAYILTRGKVGILTNKVAPYSMLGSAKSGGFNNDKNNFIDTFIDSDKNISA